MLEKQSAKLLLRVIPGATETQLVGWYGEQLKIRVKAAPEKGKANKEVLVFIAKLLEVSGHDIEMISGATNQNKRLEIKGLSQQQLMQKIDENLLEV